MPVYKTPGVYVEEISTLPPSVAEVATAVPAFIGYTERGPAETAEPRVVRVATLLEFTSVFGGAPLQKFSLTLGSGGAAPVLSSAGPATGFALHHAVSHYFKNGGGPCWVASVGNYTSSPSKAHFSAGLAALEKEDEPTLLVLTDATCLLSASAYYELCGEALAQCAKLGDRFTIIDVHGGDPAALRNDSNLSAKLMYGAAYHPYLQTSLPVAWRAEDIDINRVGAAAANVSGSLGVGGASGIVVSYTGVPGSNPGVLIPASRVADALTITVANNLLTLAGASGKTGNDVATAWLAFKGASNAGGFDITRAGDGTGKIAGAAEVPRAAIVLPQPPGETLASVARSETGLYNAARTLLEAQRVVLPPSAAVAGIYARTDREQGVWKAPANAGVMAVFGPVSKVTDDEQDRLNEDATAGKSINAIRAFTGKGTLVWGARTLAGNDNEWRYVSVRRLFITIEESARKATSFAVFEPNDATTWLKVKAMIESYLYGLWERGALAGAKPEAAYFVRVGLGTTMTAQDVLAGRMVVEVGVAAVRPAEFIILRFSHKLQTE